MASEDNKPSGQGAAAAGGGTGLTPGMVLNHRYVIERELGRGGIGAVYLARDQKMVSRPVVNKVLLEDSLQNTWVVRASLFRLAGVRDQQSLHGVATSFRIARSTSRQTAIDSANNRPVETWLAAGFLKTPIATVATVRMFISGM